MADAAEAPDGAIRRPGPATLDPAEAEAEQSDGYVESDEDGGSSIDEEPDSPNAESAADLQRLLEAHEAPFGHGVSAAVETVLAGGARVTARDSFGLTARHAVLPCVKTNQ